MCFDWNINGNRDDKNFDWDYWSLHWPKKLTLVSKALISQNNYSTLQEEWRVQRIWVCSILVICPHILQNMDEIFALFCPSFCRAESGKYFAHFLEDKEDKGLCFWHFQTFSNGRLFKGEASIEGYASNIERTLNVLSKYKKACFLC